MVANECDLNATKPTPEEALAFLESGRVFPLYEYLSPLLTPIPDEVAAAEETTRKVLVERGLYQYGPYDLVSKSLIKEMRPFLEVLENDSDEEVSKKFHELTGIPSFSVRKKLAVSSFRLLVVWVDKKQPKEICTVWDIDGFEPAEDQPVICRPELGSAD